MSYVQAQEQAVAELDNRQPTESEETTPVEGQENNQQESGQQTIGGDPNWNPTDWQLKFRDQTIVPKDKGHLISLAQQGYSYSQRMHDLKNREEQLNSQSQQYAHYKQLEDAFEKNPQFRDQIMQWYQQSLTPGVAPRQAADATPQQSSIPPELLKEIQELKGWKEEFTQYQQQQQEAKADQEIQSEIQQLQQKYTRDDWNNMSSNGDTLLKEVIKHAYEMGGVKLEAAYRDLMWDSHVKSAEVSGMKKATENQKAAKAAGVVAGGKSKSGGGGAPGVNPASMDYRDIEHLIQQEYGYNS